MWFLFCLKNTEIDGFDEEAEKYGQMVILGFSMLEM
jgi:hypothetical protein